MFSLRSLSLFYGHSFSFHIVRRLHLVCRSYVDVVAHVMFVDVMYRVSNDFETNKQRTQYLLSIVILAGLPGFARDRRSIIIHVLVAILPQFNM